MENNNAVTNRKYNNFKKQNDKSNSREVDIMFEVAYKKLFGDSLLRIEKVTDLDRQMKGIDKILHFADREPIKVDEKLRDIAWGDMLLELESNMQTGREGWLLSPNVETELIAYLFEESQEIVFVRFDELLKAYQKNAHKWVKNAVNKTNGYREVVAWNKRKGTSFSTYSICVPLADIKASVARYRFYNLQKGIMEYKAVEYSQKGAK